MSATPRPRIVDKNRIDRVDNMIACLKEGEGTVREWIAIGVADKEGYAESTAYCHPDNASLIVQAVNTFDEAKAALEEAYHELRVRCGYTEGFHAYDTIKAVLARMSG